MKIYTDTTQLGLSEAISKLLPVAMSVGGLNQIKNSVTA
jgi:hypothetical protein